ncbi:M67 family metallopeptidase [Pantanalinema sp. GBBB05]|uniref:M67 family metallopeptidase n=1 Tax=Pantanalinema sp. GBBB05 TaxID=2604139 RepID=UPI001D87AEDF|nr:M67 family metallopeptidase [Pantanalinema sp. GBBB05]
MALKLRAEHLQLMQAHAEQAYPDECCGLLLGTLVSDDKTLVDVRTVTNAWNEQVASEFAAAESALTKTRRYWISSEDMLAAMREARQRDLDVIGIYHSHPDHPAVPSECDRRQAWQHYSYLILSVRAGQAGEFYSWQLDDSHQFQSEPVIVIEPVSP